MKQTKFSHDIEYKEVPEIKKISENETVERIYSTLTEEENDNVEKFFSVRENSKETLN
jgi:hypothetical protein